MATQAQHRFLGQPVGAGYPDVAAYASKLSAGVSASAPVSTFDRGYDRVTAAAAGAAPTSVVDRGYDRVTAAATGSAPTRAVVRGPAANGSSAAAVHHGSASTSTTATTWKMDSGRGASRAVSHAEAVAAPAAAAPAAAVVYHRTSADASNVRVVSEAPPIDQYAASGLRSGGPAGSPIRSSGTFDAVAAMPTMPINASIVNKAATSASAGCVPASAHSHVVTKSPEPRKTAQVHAEYKVSPLRRQVSVPEASAPVSQPVGKPGTVQYKCPTCGALANSIEEAVAHCGADAAPQRDPDTFLDCPAAGMFRCPTCRELVPSLEAAIAHCGSTAVGMTAKAVAHGGAPKGERPRGKSSSCDEQGSFKCPICGAFAASLEEAVAHCGAGGSGGNGAIAQDAPRSDGEIVAFDEQGKRSIVRRTDPETGESCTVVFNEDGSESCFGDSTILSLTKSKSEKAERWIASLARQQLRGLIHEAGQRLLTCSRVYNEKRSDLEKLGEKLNYMYFGLSFDASEIDLDKAYRQFAKRMHPDKNGGTEEAKEKFQRMKERYEALKRSRGEAGPRQEEEEPRNAGEAHAPDAARAAQSEPPSGDARQGGRPRPDAEKEDKAGEPREAEGQQEESEEDAKAAGKANSMQYDPKDKESMLRALSNMIAQLKHLQEQTEAVVSEIQRVQSHVPSSA